MIGVEIVQIHLATAENSLHSFFIVHNLSVYKEIKNELFGAYILLLGASFF